MRQFRFAIVVAVALAFVAGLSGCGSSGSSPPSGAVNPTVSASASAAVSAAVSAGASAASAGATLNPTSNAGRTQSVTIKNFAFTPSTVTIRTGVTVTWVNQDSTAHTVTANNNAFASSDLATGQKFSFTFTKTGTYAYHCSIHSYMTGTVIVQ